MPKARTWKQVRADAIAKGLIDQNRVAAETERLHDVERSYRLQEIRKTRCANQASLADQMGISQSRVSRIERGELDHTELSTLRAYVAALGGTIEIVANFGDERLVVG